MAEPVERPDRPDLEAAKLRHIKKLFQLNPYGMPDPKDWCLICREPWPCLSMQVLAYAASLEREMAALLAVAKAAETFDADLSENCDGPPRDKLCAAVAAWRVREGKIQA